MPVVDVRGNTFAPTLHLNALFLMATFCKEEWLHVIVGHVRSACSSMISIV